MFGAEQIQCIVHLFISMAFAVVSHSLSITDWPRTSPIRYEDNAWIASVTEIVRLSASKRHLRIMPAYLQHFCSSTTPMHPGVYVEEIQQTRAIAIDAHGLMHGQSICVFAFSCFAQTFSVHTMRTAHGYAQERHRQNKFKLGNFVKMIPVTDVQV